MEITRIGLDLVVSQTLKLVELERPPDIIMLPAPQTPERRWHRWPGSGPLADHVGDLDPRDGCGSRMEGLEAQHRAGDPLDEAMILFKNVVEVFDLPDRDHAALAGTAANFRLSEDA